MFKKKNIVIDGRKVFYWEQNPNNKEVMVFLHGFPGNHKGLLDMAKNFHGKRLVVPDLPACGISEPMNKKHNLNNYSDWLNDFLKVLSIENPIIVGHSFGARLTLVFGSRYPKVAEKLVFITPVVRVEGLISRLVAVEYKIAEKIPEELKQRWLANKVHTEVKNIILFRSCSEKQKQKFLQRDKAELKRLDPQINIEMFNEFSAHSLVPLGKKIQVPSLVIASDEDYIAPLDSVEEFALQLDNSDFVLMKNSGHVVVSERPTKTANVIKNWLKK